MKESWIHTIFSDLHKVETTWLLDITRHYKDHYVHFMCQQYFCLFNLKKGILSIIQWMHTSTTTHYTQWFNEASQPNSPWLLRIRLFGKFTSEAVFSWKTSFDDFICRFCFLFGLIGFLFSLTGLKPRSTGALLKGKHSSNDIQGSRLGNLGSLEESFDEDTCFQ